jgi:Skp family chaperone for outer membrane proteins
VILVQRVLDESVEGKAIAARLQALQQAKLAALTEKNKQYEAAQQKVNTLAAGSDERVAAQKEVDRLQVEIQRMQQDAQAELDDARTTQYREFERKLGPVVQQIFIERQLRLIISREAEGLLWVSPEIDLTAEVVKRFDQAMAAAKPPAPVKSPEFDPR